MDEFKTAAAHIFLPVRLAARVDLDTGKQR